MPRENRRRSPARHRFATSARTARQSSELTGSDVDTPAQDLPIPQSLAEFGQREGVSFRHTLLLLDLQRRIIAARTPGKKSPKATLDDVDWRHFFEAVKSFL